MIVLIEQILHSFSLLLFSLVFNTTCSVDFMCFYVILFVLYVHMHIIILSLFYPFVQHFGNLVFV